VTQKFGTYTGTCDGGKKYKDGLTVLICYNAETEKLQPLVMGMKTTVHVNIKLAKMHRFLQRYFASSCHVWKEE
jgi:hypothetical protein